MFNGVEGGQGLQLVKEGRVGVMNYDATILYETTIIVLQTGG